MTSRTPRRILEDLAPEGVARVAPGLYRSAIDTRTLDVEERRVKRVAQALVFSGAMIEPGPEWLLSDSLVLHSSVRKVMLAVAGLPARSPTAPEMRPAERALVERCRAATDDIQVNPYRHLDRQALDRVFDSTVMLNDDFLDSYMSVLDMNYGDADTAFLFISFLNNTSTTLSGPDQRTVDRMMFDAREPLSRFFANDDATLYAVLQVHGCHWISLRWDRGAGTVEITDSMLALSEPLKAGEYTWSARPFYVATILDKLRRLGSLVEPDMIRVAPVTQQPDDVSCGLFALFSVRRLALGIRDKKARLGAWRRYFLAEILTQRIPLYPDDDVVANNGI